MSGIRFAGLLLAFMVAFSLFFLLLVDAMQYEATGDCDGCLLLPYVSPSVPRVR